MEDSGWVELKMDVDVPAISLIPTEQFERELLQHHGIGILNIYKNRREERGKKNE